MDNTPSGTCRVSLRRGEERKTILMRDWPRQQFYSDAELTAVEYHRPPAAVSA